MLFKDYGPEILAKIRGLEHVINHIAERTKRMSLDLTRITEVEAAQTTLINGVVARLGALEQALRDVADTIANEAVAQAQINALADQTAALNVSLQAALDANPLPGANTAPANTTPVETPVEPTPAE